MKAGESSATLVAVIEPRPGATPVQMKRQARVSKVLPCCLKERTAYPRGRRCMCPIPAPAFRTWQSGTPTSLAQANGVGGVFCRNPPSRNLQNPLGKLLLR